MEIVSMVYAQINNLPNVEKFGLSSQIKRAVVSIPSNIAEGCSRNSNKELNRYLEISLGSSFELETQLIICGNLKYLEDENLSQLLMKIHSFQRMCNSFRSKILTN